MIYETVAAIKNKILRRVAICAIAPVLLILFIVCFIVGAVLAAVEPVKQTYRECVSLFRETAEAFVKLWQMKEDEKSE